MRNPKRIAIALMAAFALSACASWGHGKMGGGMCGHMSGPMCECCMAGGTKDGMKEGMMGGMHEGGRCMMTNQDGQTKPGDKMKSGQQCKCCARMAGHMSNEDKARAK
jgi:hypothetical protein